MVKLAGGQQEGACPVWRGVQECHPMVFYLPLKRARNAAIAAKPIQIILEQNPPVTVWATSSYGLYLMNLGSEAKSQECASKGMC